MKKTLTILAVLAMAAPVFGAPLFSENFDYATSGEISSLDGSPWLLDSSRDSDWVVDAATGKATVGPGEGHQYQVRGAFDEVKAILTFDLTYGGGCGYDSNYFARFIKGVSSVQAAGIGIASHGTDLGGEFIEIGLTGGTTVKQASGFKLYSGQTATLSLGSDSDTGIYSLWIDKDTSLAPDLTDTGAADEVTGVNMFAYGPQGTMTIDNMVVEVPEPATMSLLALGGLGVLIRRRRR